MYNLDKRSYLAKTLRRLRVEAGFTQQNMADVLNINRSTYTYYETGKTTPDIQSLKILANVLNVDIETFLEDENSSRLIMLGEYDAKRRPRKRVESNPQHVGELSFKEKQLIAFLRVKGDKALESILDSLIPDNPEEDCDDDNDYSDDYI